MLHRTDWASIKQIKSDNSFILYYVSDSPQYTVIGGDRNQIYWTIVKTSSDITDFENNFKSGATSVISLDDAISKIFLNQSQLQEVVDAVQSIGVSVSLARFRPRFLANQTAVTIGTSDTSLGSISADGKLESIMVRLDTNLVDIVLKVDGIEIFREKLLDLKTGALYNLDKTSVGPMADISLNDSGKQIFFAWKMPVDFLTSVEVLAKQNGGSGDKKAIIIQYREKIA